MRDHSRCALARYFRFTIFKVVHRWGFVLPGESHDCLQLAFLVNLDTVGNLSEAKRRKRDAMNAALMDIIPLLTVRSLLP